jgi:cyclic-di-GMP phosphodiesterase TipF (flagellum assembly factor)
MFELGQGEAQRPGVTAALVPLRRLGFSFALDRVSDLSVDFAKLAQVGFKTVKVEAARLLGDMARSGTHPKLPELAEALRRAGVALIADKIENEAAAERLARFGVTLGQGFLFGEPRIAGDGR